MGSTRPFLEDIEKKWLAFQLLCAVRDSHARNVYHGDIKTENILVTSWNWLYLADFSSSFKKTYLPEDNPADFSYFFDTSGRRTCYIAPERFSEAGSKGEDQDLTWAMDVFSVGCVIAEIFLEAPIFTLSQLFKYRRSEFDPSLVYLDKIQDKEIKEMVKHMVQLDPESRYTAEEYLKFWRHKAFPDYFTSFLHQYMGLMTDPSSGREPVLPETESFGDADQRIERVFNDFDKISYFLGHKNGNTNTMEMYGQVSSDGTLPVYLDIASNKLEAAGAVSSGTDDGSLIFLSLVASSLRHAARAMSKLRACDLMLAFATKITDEAKLDRVLPYVVSLLSDKSDLVKAAALRTTTQILSIINVVSPVNAYVFSEYIRPRLLPFVGGSGTKTKAFVRATYASCLASLAHSSMRILDVVQALRADGSIPTNDPEAEDEGDSNISYRNMFDVAKIDLLDHFEAHTKALLTDKDPSVRRALLGSVSSLCVFFGTAKANDVILTYLNTYVNDPDWMLRCAFFHTSVGVATFIGGTSLEEFLLPLMIQALSDAEELVTEKVLTSLDTMSQLGLFQPVTLWEVVAIVGRFMMHPNPWIRSAAVMFTASSTTYLPPADIETILAPLLQRYLKSAILDYSVSGILDSLRKPLSRSVMDMAMAWAASVRTDDSPFWKSILGASSLDLADGKLSPALRKTGTPSLEKVPTNVEDDQWIKKLRNFGLTSEDEFKVLSLGNHIWRCSTKKAALDTMNDPASPLNNIRSLKELDVTPQTVFFEKRSARHGPRRSSSGEPLSPSDGRRRKPMTIADALLDASEILDVDGKTPRRGSQQSSRDPSLRPPSVASSGRPSSGHGRSPTDALKREAAHGLRHKSSAMQLLRDNSKAAAETGTSSENAFGDLEGPKHQVLNSHSKPGGPRKGPQADTYTAHTYDGNDPTVMKLLDNMASESNKPEESDFGPPHPHVRPAPASREAGDLKKVWRPEGVLVSAFAEHTALINRVLPSPDHTFFITGSSDGTVKVWDTLRLERNITYRSRQTYRHSEKGQVKCLAFIGNTYAFASGASDGSIHIVKVDYTQVGDTSKYGRLKKLRSFQLPAEEYPLWMETYRSDSPSTSWVLIICTNLSRIVALNLRDMSELYSFTNPLHHGTPLCFCISHKRDWLLLGTSHGVLDFWDLRFQLKLKSWGWLGAGGKPVRRVMVHPYRGKGKWVSVLGGSAEGEITIWDLEKWICREVFRAAPNTARGNASSAAKPKSYDLKTLDDDIGNKATNTSLDQFLLSNDDTSPSTTENKQQQQSPDSTSAIRALTMWIDHPEEKQRENKHGFLFTGGNDRKLRIWDIPRFEDTSKVMSGLDVEEAQPKFVTSQVGSVVVHAEKLTPTPLAPSSKKDVAKGVTTKATSTAAGAAAAAAAQQAGSSSSSDNSKRKKGVGDKTAGEKMPRSTLISLQQQNLLRRHLDSIMDVAILERPALMTVSVDRAGGVYVFE